jgi:hypothetical protein
MQLPLTVWLRTDHSVRSSHRESATLSYGYDLDCVRLFGVQHVEDKNPVDVRQASIEDLEQPITADTDS